MHRASQDNTYLAYIQSNGHTMGADEDDFSFSWDDKRPGTKILLSKVVFQKYSPISAAYIGDQTKVLTLFHFLTGILGEKYGGISVV